MLEQEETLRLIKLAQNGDKTAKDKLINENSPLVKSIIKRFLNKGVEYDDLYQLGCLGFLKAIDNFKEEFGGKFSTYLVPMVIGEIKRFMRDDGAIKVSRAIKTTNMKINRFISEYVREHHDKPSIEVIAKEFDMSMQEVVFTMDSARMPISIYSPLEEDGGGKTLQLLDRFQASIDQSEVVGNNIMLKEALQELGERDKKIVLLRFFRDKTQGEIAKELGVSQVQVSRLENKIIEKLKFKLG